jgi:hypothetical protein
MILCLTINLADQHRIVYSKLSDNEDDDTLDPNVMVNVDDDVDNDIDNDVDDEINFVYEFRDVSEFSFVVFNDWELSHRCMPGEFDLEVEQTLNSKNELVNAVK